MRTATGIWLVLWMQACGCGRLPVGAAGEEPGPGGGGSKAPVVTAPSLLMASPSHMAVGDALLVYGKGFLPKQLGRVELRFLGTYTTSGVKQPVDLEVRSTVVNSGKLKWVLWPGVVFDKGGDRLGRFSGTITATNLPLKGKPLASAALPLTLTIMPSLIPGMRAHGASCSTQITRTAREKTPMSLSATAVGLRPATKEAPLVFVWSLQTKQWTMSFAYYGAVWIPSASVVTVEDRVTSGATSTLTPGGKGTYKVRQGQVSTNGLTLNKLETGAVPAAAVVFPITSNVEVTDADGKKIRLVFTLEARRRFDAVYEGKVRLRERFYPRPVTDCIPGGDIGRQVTYSEDKGETKARSVSFNYNGLHGGPGTPSNPFALGIDWSARFGFDVSASVSSAKSVPSLSGQVLPGEYGMFYRQTVKLEHSAPIYLTSACGQMYLLGYALVTDWRWDVDLATGSMCPPSTKLPKAQKYF